MANIKDKMFDHRKHAMLKANNPEKALEYLNEWQNHLNTINNPQKAERAKKIELLRQHGVKVFPGRKEETLDQKITELGLSI